MLKLVLEKAEEMQIKLPTSVASKKQESFRKISTSALLTMSKPLTVSVQFTSVTQLCLTLCDSMNHSTPGLPIHLQFPEFTQTHVYRVSDAIKPSHPLSSSSPLGTNPSQHQVLFQWVNTSYEVAKVLEFQLQHQSFQWSPRTDLLAVQGTLKSLLLTTVQKHQFFSTQLSSQSNSHIHTWPLDKP